MLIPIVNRKSLSPSRGGAPTLYCGDPHGQFAHIVEAAERTQAAAVILLGDMELQRPLEVELASIRERVWWIRGNHDTDAESSWTNLWHSELADRDLDGRVVELPNGTRIAGLGGVFRGAVWMPIDKDAPRVRSRAGLAEKTPRQNRWRDRDRDGPVLKHWSSIYPDEYDRLAHLRADVLVTHEAPEYHRHGFAALDELATALRVKLAVHGHHHDAVDSSTRWATQGFKTFGVGLRGITAIDLDGNAEIVVPRQEDLAPGYRSRHADT